ncbi:MAG: metallophosphoesterase family protein [Bryobacterales bacterium]|nr:metallophosphoesterase family protein [Bryobacterales bacterium]
MRMIPILFLWLPALVMLPAAQLGPYITHDTRPVITNGPYLLAPAEDSATIVWMTDTPCHSKVVYEDSGGRVREAENGEHGLLPVGLRHVVRLRGLQPGATYRYRVVSTRVVKMKSYWPEKGLSVESRLASFTTFDRRKPACSFSLITDTHEDVKRIASLVQRIDWGGTDFLVHLGDAFHGIESEEAIWNLFLEPLSNALAQTRPLLFVRGNHEARGAAARLLADYVPFPEGRFYYARDHGPVHFVTLDTGEDKDDETNVYAGLNRFKAYREEELAWFREHARTTRRMAEAPFRVLLMHNPGWGWVDQQNGRWTEAANEAGIDLAISGHTHRFAHWEPGRRGNRYHQLIIGPDEVARVDASQTELQVRVTGKDGETVASFSVPRRK